MNCAKLLSALWDFQQMKSGRVDVKYILINYELFYDLAKDKESLKWLFVKDGKMIFAGIPMIRTREVEYLDFCI